IVTHWWARMRLGSSSRMSFRSTSPVRRRREARVAFAPPPRGFLETFDLPGTALQRHDTAHTHLEMDGQPRLGIPEVVDTRERGESLLTLDQDVDLGELDLQFLGVLEILAQRRPHRLWQGEMQGLHLGHLFPFERASV